MRSAFWLLFGKSLSATTRAARVVILRKVLRWLLPALLFFDDIMGIAMVTWGRFLRDYPGVALPM